MFVGVGVKVIVKVFVGVGVKVVVKVFVGVGVKVVVKVFVGVGVYVQSAAVSVAFAAAMYPSTVRCPAVAVWITLRVAAPAVSVAAAISSKRKVAV